MKILQLCKKFPHPTIDGETIAIVNLSKALVEKGCEVDLLAMNTSRHFADLSKVNGTLEHYTLVESVSVDNKIRPLAAMTNLIKKRSYHISRFESPDFASKLKDLLSRKTYDVIQLETLYLTPYIPIIRRYSNAAISMRAHNIEHEIWERISENTRSFPKKWYLGLLSRQLKDFEIEHLNEYDLLIAITERDLKRFKELGYRNGMVATPVGIDLNRYRSIMPQETDHFRLSFIGSLDWMPNQDGLTWFLQNVWPAYAGMDEVISLHVAGRNTPKAL